MPATAGFVQAGRKWRDYGPQLIGPVDILLVRVAGSTTLDLPRSALELLLDRAPELT